MKKYFPIIVLSLMLLGGCKTYHITTQSLLEQFADVHKETKVTVLIAPPYMFFPGIVDGNSLRTITVLDKKDKAHTLPIGRHMGIKITQNDGKKTTFYFDTLLLKDSTITGNKTHFFKMKIKPVYFADISKMELQK